MLERILTLIEKYSNRRNLLLGIVVCIVTITVMSIATQTLVYDVYGDFTMPDMRIGYAFSEIQAAFTSIGIEGLRMWAIAHSPDFLFPLAYSFSMMFAINMELNSLGKNSGLLRKSVLFPLLGGVADYIENVLILSQIAVFPNLSEIVIAFASIITLLKWIFLMLGFIVIFGLLVLIIYKRIVSKE